MEEKGEVGGRWVKMERRLDVPQVSACLEAPERGSWREGEVGGGQAGGASGLSLWQAQSAGGRNCSGQGAENELEYLSRGQRKTKGFRFCLRLGPEGMWLCRGLKVGVVVGTEPTGSPRRSGITLQQCPLL